jgi:Uma2 family endonuclease
VRSPGDESFDKIPFYDRVGVAEYLIIDRDTKDVRRWQATPDGLTERQPDPEGWHTLAGLPLAFQGGDGRLRVRASDRVEDL